jgi:hypothetical protein
MGFIHEWVFLHWCIGRCVVTWGLELVPWNLVEKNKIKQVGVSGCVALLFTLKSILRSKKNYGNSQIVSPCKNIILKKSYEKNQNPWRYYNFRIISSLNTSQNIIFQKILI